MRRFSPLAGLAVVFCLGGSSLASPSHAQSGLNVRMQKVLAQFVESTGNSVMGVGSWISGQGFNAATSDFDMRLVIGQGGTEAQQLARWQQARNQMANLIRQEFGDQAGNILNRTNLYAPNQLMKGVENAADAMERFQSLKTVPNLGHTGPVNAQTTAKYAEGLYGTGAQTYVQGYEKGAGRLFYSNNGKCVTGLSELAHMGEGAPTYTAAGTANTAGQWADHAVSELKAGRGDKVAKYLERLERDLFKSRSLSGLPMDPDFRNELSNMRKLLKEQPWKLADMADDVGRLVARSRAEAALLRNMAEAGPVRQAYLRVMFDGIALKNKVGDLINKVMAKMPDAVNAENAMNFIVFCIGTKAASESFGRGDDAFQTMSNVCGAMNPFKMIGPVLLAEVMAEVITQARLGGYDMAAGFQGAWDLMEGIYSAWGRCDVDPDPRMRLTLADMVANYQLESKLEARVYQHCLRASTRNLGAANAMHDEGVAAAIFAKCWPTIRNAWLWERDNLTTEYLKLGSEVVHMPLIIYYSPTSPQVGQKVVCEARSLDGKLGDRLERMSQIIKILYGKSAGISTSYYWTPAGASVSDRDWQRGFTFAAKGKYPVKVRLSISPFASFPKTEPRVMLQREVPALVEIVVGGQGQLCPHCGKPAGTTPGCMWCTLYNHDPTKDPVPGGQ